MGCENEYYISDVFVSIILFQKFIFFWLAKEFLALMFLCLLLSTVENISHPKWLVNSFQGWSFCLQGLLPEVWMHCKYKLCWKPEKQFKNEICIMYVHCCGRFFWVRMDNWTELCCWYGLSTWLIGSICFFRPGTHACYVISESRESTLFKLLIWFLINKGSINLEGVQKY